MKLKQIRQRVVENLLANYRQGSQQLQCIENQLTKKNLHPIYFDHFAIIDLPGPQTGIPHLKRLFSLLGYTERGQGYLPEKQNDFVWMAETDYANQAVRQVLPQAVVADFRLEALPQEISKIIEKYSSLAPTPPLDIIETQIHQLGENADPTITVEIIRLVCHYLSGRDWPLPRLKEFLLVWEFNPLLAWVLVFGRKPNHFTLSIHLLTTFLDLNDFHQLLKHDLQLEFNQAGGSIKGGEAIGIAQSSTVGMLETIYLADGETQLPTGFVEFVWRYAQSKHHAPVLWEDFFTGFIAHQATHVIQSLSPTKE